MAKKLYNYRWQVARKRFLQNNPLCVFCDRKGAVKAASVVDHITPHKGDEALFWKESNWQALCKPCHDRDKAKMEAGSYAGCDVEGKLLQM